MALTIKPVDYGKLGRFFAARPKAYAIATATDVDRILQPGEYSVGPQLRNTWPLHAALAALVEGVIERMVLITQTTDTLPGVAAWNGAASVHPFDGKFKLLDRTFLDNLAAVKRYAGGEVLALAVQALGKMFATWNRFHEITLPGGMKASVALTAGAGMSLATGVDRWLNRDDPWVLENVAAVMFSQVWEALKGPAGEPSPWLPGDVRGALIEEFDYIVTSGPDIERARSFLRFAEGIGEEELFRRLGETRRLNLVSVDLLVGAMANASVNAIVPVKEKKLAHLTVTRTRRYDVARDGKVELAQTDDDETVEYFPEFRMERSVTHTVEGAWEVDGSAGKDFIWFCSVRIPPGFFSSVAATLQPGEWMPVDLSGLPREIWNDEGIDVPNPPEPPPNADDPVTLVVATRSTRPIREGTEVVIPDGWPAKCLVDGGYVRESTTSIAMRVEKDELHDYYPREGDGETTFDEWVEARDLQSERDAAVVQGRGTTLPAGVAQAVDWMLTLLGEKFGDISHPGYHTPEGVEAQLNSGGDNPAVTADGVFAGKLKDYALQRRADGSLHLLTDDGGEQDIGSLDEEIVHVTSYYMNWGGYARLHSQTARVIDMGESAKVSVGDAVVVNSDWNWGAVQPSSK